MQVNELEYFSYLSEFIAIQNSENAKEEYFLNSGISYSVNKTDISLLGIWNKSTESFWQAQVSLGLKQSSQEHIAFAYLFSNEEQKVNIFRFSYRYSF